MPGDRPISKEQADREAGEPGAQGSNPSLCVSWRPFLGPSLETAPLYEANLRFAFV